MQSGFTPKDGLLQALKADPLCRRRPEVWTKELAEPARAGQAIVVVLPGIMGSALADRDGKEVWGTSLGSIVKGVLTRGAAIKRLQLPDGIGDEHRAVIFQNSFLERVTGAVKIG